METLPARPRLVLARGSYDRPVDISIDGISEYGVSSKDRHEKREKAQKEAHRNPSRAAPTGHPRRVDAHPELKDFYNQHDDFTVTNKDRNAYAEALAALEPWEKDLLKQGKHLYLVDLSNVGGMVMPLILEIELKSGKKYVERVPAEVWALLAKKITRSFHHG